MDRWLCALLCGYAAAFLLPSTPTAESWLSLLGIAVLMISVALICRYRVAFTQNYTETKRIRLASSVAILAAIVCGICWGIGNATLALRYQLPAHQVGTTATIRIKINAIPLIQDDFWRVQGSVEHLAGQPLPVQPLARLNWYDPEISLAPPQVGETWLLRVKLRTPQGPRNQGGFLYHRYLLAEGIQLLGTVRHGQRLKSGWSWRQNLYNTLNEHTRDLPFFGVMLALVMGQREHLDPDHRDVFQRTGLAHLIAISGLHLTLLVGVAMWIATNGRWLMGRSRARRDYFNALRWTWWFAVTLALLYAWLAGFATATVRALVMILVVLAHRRLAQRLPLWRVLLRSVALVLVIEPLAPLKSGFWLSVCAVAIILWMQWRWPPLQGRWQALRALWRLEVVLTLALWPLMLLWFGGLPLLAPVTNLLLVPVFAVWILPLALLGLLFTVFGLPQLTHFLWWLAEAPLRIVWPSLQWLSESSWQWLTAAQTWPLWAVILGLMLCALPFNWRRRLLGLGALTLSVLIQQALQAQQRELVLTILDVEQGSAAVIERQGHALLIDTGAQWSSGGDMASRVIIPYLAAHRLQPELAFISHSDNDHRGGYASLNRVFPELLWFGPATPAGYPCVAGQSGMWRDVQWQVLHPRWRYNNQRNNDSCVIRLQYRDLVILLPGDIEKPAERALLAHSAPVQADILVLAHHGSNSSSEAYFIDHVKPSIAIVSRGRNNPYGMVDPRVLARLQDRSITLFDTATGGQVQLVTDGSSWDVRQPLAAHFGSWFDRDN